MENKTLELEKKVQDEKKVEDVSKKTRWTVCQLCLACCFVVLTLWVFVVLLHIFIRRVVLHQMQEQSFGLQRDARQDLL